MKLLPLALVAFLATPANANLQQNFQTQQQQETQAQQRRRDLCLNHREQAQYQGERSGIQYLYRVSRGDLYQIRWTEGNTLLPTPCQVKLLGQLNTDQKVCDTEATQRWGCDPRSTTRFVVEGNELVSYSTMNMVRGSWDGKVRRNVLGVKM